MNEDLSNIQRQVVDLQERMTALEAGGRGQAGGGDLMGLFAGAVSVAGRIARAASDAQATHAEPEEAPAAAAGRPRGRLAAKLAELREDRGDDPHRDHVHRRLTPEEAATVPPKGMFPITEDRSGFRTDPAAQFAGRTAPRRTLPPEAPVRLWNREHTDHLDVIGRAVPGVENTQVRIRNNQTDNVRAWLAPLIEPDDCGPVYVAWMDREWSLAGYSFGDNSTGVLDLLPLPKPPRVDQVLGRPSVHDQLLARLNDGQTLPEATRPKVAPPADAPYAGPFPDLQAGDKIGVEHPDGTITTHEFSGDPANPNTRRDALAQATRDSADEVCAARSGEGLTCEGKPDHCGAHYATDHETSGGRIVVWGAGQRAIDAIDEVLPMPGGPNDRLSKAAAESLCYHRNPIPVGGPGGGRYACTLADGHLGHHAAHISPDSPPVSIWANDVTTAGGYADLYSRLDAIHDATAEEES